LSPLFATVYLKSASGGSGALIATFFHIQYSIHVLCNPNFEIYCCS